MTGQEIINKFRIYVGDQSELSSQEELDLLNKVYDKVLTYKPWEFLKKSATGNTTTSGSDTIITLPSDFRYFVENRQRTDNTQSGDITASPKAVFIGSNYTPYQIVNFSDRRQFRNEGGYAYYDPVNSRLVFTTTPPETSYEFDYIAKWDALTTATSPVFPSEYHNMLFHYMAVDSVIINMFDRAHSYAAENQRAADKYLQDLCYYNSMLTYN